jgi:hypothetical protein
MKQMCSGWGIRMVRPYHRAATPVSNSDHLKIEIDDWSN